jgi:hypothetical protein
MSPSSTVPSWIEIFESPVRRKVFISHSHLHSGENEAFLRDFGDVFVPFQLGIQDDDDFINSADTEYVMRRIREEYVHESTVTIVLVGPCVHSRRYIDWEIKASLNMGVDSLPNGLLAITLPSVNGSAYLPERLSNNWQQGEARCYALYRSYPTSKEQLRSWIEAAHARRKTHHHLVVNARNMWSHNRKCLVHEYTH